MGDPSKLPNTLDKRDFVVPNESFLLLKIVFQNKKSEMDISIYDSSENRVANYNNSQGRESGNVELHAPLNTSGRDLRYTVVAWNKDRSWKTGNLLDRGDFFGSCRGHVQFAPQYCKTTFFGIRYGWYYNYLEIAEVAAYIIESHPISVADSGSGVSNATDVSPSPQSDPVDLVPIADENAPDFHTLPNTRNCKTVRVPQHGRFTLSVKFASQHPEMDVSIYEGPKNGGGRRIGFINSLHANADNVGDWSFPDNSKDTEYTIASWNKSKEYGWELSRMHDRGNFWGCPVCC